MLRTISLLIVIHLTAAYSQAQKTTIEDPDITFSFKKPKGWTLKDDGYYLNLYAPAADTDSLDYISFTYYELPSGTTEANEVMLQRADTKEPNYRLISTENIQLKKTAASIEEYLHDSEMTQLLICEFDLHQQLFECRLKTFGSENGASKKAFKQFLKSLNVD